MTDALTAFGSVFLMTRLRDGAHHEQISSTLASVLAEHSLELTRADWQLEREELWANVRHCMERAQYGVAFFDRVLKVRPKFP